MPNSIWLYRLYDVAEEIRLDQVEKTFAHIKPTFRLRLSRMRLKSIHIPNPPVTVELGEERIKIGPQDFRVRFTGKVYDLRVVSLIMQIFLPPDASYNTIRDLAIYLSENDEIEEIFHAKLAEIQKSLGKAMIHPGLRSAEEEDYTLFFFQKWRQDWDLCRYFWPNRNR